MHTFFSFISMSIRRTRLLVSKWFCNSMPLLLTALNAPASYLDCLLKGRINFMLKDNGIKASFFVFFLLFSVSSLF